MPMIERIFVALKFGQAGCFAGVYRDSDHGPCWAGLLGLNICPGIDMPFAGGVPETTSEYPTICGMIVGKFRKSVIITMVRNPESADIAI